MSTQHVVDFNVDNWGGYARCYDTLNELIPYQDLQKRVIQLLDPQQSEHTLDAACGTGNLIWNLRKQCCGSAGTITGFDFSEEMLDRAHEKCVHEQTHFLRTDFNMTLPFANDSFDQVVSMNALYALSKPEHAITECARVLKKDGQLVIVTPKKGYQNGLILKKHCGSTKPNAYWMNAHQSPEREWKLIQESMGDTARARKMMAVAKYNRMIATTGTFHFFSANEITELLHRAGFICVHTELIYAKQALLIHARKQPRRA